MADTLSIQVDTNTDEVAGWVRHVFRDQLPFATSRAINATAKDFQERQRERQRRIFTVRNRTFMDRAVKIRRGDFATKAKLRAIVRVEPPGGQERADILTKFETGGTKTPRAGRSLAVPEDARRLKRGRIRKADRPKSLEFRLHGRGPKATVYRGRRRTFLIRYADGTGGIYRRSGRGTARASSLKTRNVRDVNVQTLFRFTSTARIDDRLNFVDTAQEVVARRFDRNFTEAFDKAVKTARRKKITTSSTVRQAAARLSALDNLLR